MSILLHFYSLLRRKVCLCSNREVRLQIGADGYEKVEECRHRLCDAGIFLLKEYSFYLPNLPLYA